MEEKKDLNIDSTNIFDEFSNDEKLKEEVKQAEYNSTKWLIFYMNWLNWFMKIFNFLAILFLILFFLYSYIQSSSNFDKKEFIAPFCDLLLDKKANIDCAPVTEALSEIKKSNEAKEVSYYNSIISMVWSVYELSNFAFSKEVLFLLDKSDSRLKPLEILKKFDTLKNKFQPINKNRLKCYNFVVSSVWELSMQCDGFSSQWDKDIIWASWSQWDWFVLWTSISYVSSFINYIETTSDDFIIINKPKKFNSTSVVSNNGFTKKTSFKLTLKIKENNILLK